MKRNVAWVLTAFLTTSLILLPGCETGIEKKDSGEITDLLAKINSSWSAMGLKIEAEQTGVNDEPLETTRGKVRQLFTFKNATITIDTSGLKEIRPGTTFKKKKVFLEIKELALRYGPKDDFLQFVSCKGLDLDWNFTKTEEEAKAGSDMALKISVGSASFDRYDISPLLNSKTANAMELLAELMAKNPELKTTAENLTYEIHTPLVNRKIMSTVLSFAKIEGKQSYNSDLFYAIYSKRKDVTLPNFEKLLQQGTPLFDMTLKGKDFNASLKIDGKQMGSGHMANADISYFLKPDEDRSYFTYGIRLYLEDLKATAAELEGIETLGDFRELGIKASLVNLTPGFTRAYFELLKKSAELSASGNKEEMRKYRSAMGMKIFMELMKSKPKLTFSVSPFKHSLGQLEAKGHFRFSGVSIPVGKAAVIIPGFHRIRAKLETGGKLPPFIAKSIISALKYMVIEDEAGNGTITFETREDFPGQFFLNGKPIRK
jgi:hypothetical protein